MSLKKGVLAFALAVVLIISGCSQDETVQVEISRDIKPLDLERTTLNSLPEFNPYSSKLRQIDLRGYDLTRLELKDSYEELIHADFDTVTKWPYWLPEGFDPKKILENGKNPGLGIKSLHDAGITGKGVSVAIISNVLLPGHSEYNLTLKLYEEISCDNEAASVEGCSQASLLVGKTTGVAPEADLYYIAVSSDPGTQDTGFSPSYETRVAGDPVVLAVNRIVEVNEGLEEGSKIRVLCIGLDVGELYQGHVRLEQAVRKAMNAGIFVVSTDLYRTYNYQMDFNGLARDPMADPDSLDAYRPGHAWENHFYTFGRYVRAMEGLLVPMDARTAAAPTGTGQYAYYAMNDRTLCVPYIGGLYALACQVNPSITPETFWEKALETGDYIALERNGISYSFKKIVNPVALMKAIKE